MGVPARIIGDINSLIEKRREETSLYYRYSYEEYVELLWDKFDKEKEK